MSKLPAQHFSRPQLAADWIQPLVEQLNQQRTELRATLSALTFKENFAAEVKELTITGPSPAWIAPTLTNSWANFGSSFNDAGYRLAPGARVYLKGLVKSGTVNTGSSGNIFTLPSGYLPPSHHIFAVASNSAFGECRVLNDGSVRAYGGSNTSFSLDGISFDVSSGALPTPPTWPQGAPLIQTSLAQVAGVILLGFRALDATNQSSIGLGAPVLEWEQTGDRAVKLRAIWGLSPGKRYSLRLLLIGG